MSDIGRFWIEILDSEIPRKLVVLASDHDRVFGALKYQNEVLAKQLEKERARVAELQKEARQSRVRSLGVVRVVK